MSPDGVERPMTVLLLRHAESEWNRVGRWQGTEDPPLSDAGRRDAVRVARRLGSFSSIWTSPLSRARETATIVGSALDDIPIHVDARLVEVHFADWQGLNVDEIDARWPGLRANGQRPPGAESDNDVSNRALAALASIVGLSADADGAILVVTHGGLIRTVCRYLRGPVAALPNLGGVWLEATAGSWRVSDSWRPELAPAGDSL